MNILFAEERRKTILNILEKKERVQVNKLSKKFNVSEATIRRDLTELEKEGLILRTHGGAMKAGSRRFEPSLEEKIDSYIDEKKKIGYKASQFIKDGDTILIDAGTTTVQIIKHLLNKKDITLVTNGLNIINEIKSVGLEIEVVLIGGVFKSKTQALVGPLAENSLKNIRVDKAFIGTNGFTIKDGATTPDLAEAEIKKTMINNAQEVWLIFDHSKFNRVAFSKFAGLNDIHYIIINKIDDKARKKIEESGVEVIIAD